MQFIIKRDRKGYFQFASIQSEVGQKLLQQYQVTNDIDSLVLIEENRVFIESTAAIKISRHLDGLWPFCYACIIVPSFIRNACYRAFAKRRYRWFGQKKTCMMPTHEERKRFL